MLFREDAAARAQHMAVRENAGWYRWTHDLVEVTGPDAGKFLDRLFVNDIAGAPYYPRLLRNRARGLAVVAGYHDDSDARPLCFGN